MPPGPWSLKPGSGNSVLSRELSGTCRDEEIYFYADLEQNIISLKNLFTFYTDANRGFIQPVIGMAAYGLPADYLFRPYMGFGLFSRLVFGEEEPVYLSKTITWGVDFPPGNRV